MKTLIKLLTSTIVLTAIVGCGSSYEPVVDGPKNNKYYGDLNACQSLAAQTDKGKTKAGVVAGGVTGGLLSSKGNREDIATGAAVGAALGTTAGAIADTSTQRNVIRTCMRNRGWNVLN